MKNSSYNKGFEATLKVRKALENKQTSSLCSDVSMPPPSMLHSVVASSKDLGVYRVLNES